ncbi:unnamed protein product [Hermetia illucens]|uniref:Uncharacterized protein n=1 Tax=Hermetia illucens TaxID=343691 RepID=A0A7R8YLN0_HERIL|nr:unnamed protein product [Hermetia illucens]
MTAYTSFSSDLVTNSFEVHSQGANGTRAYNGHQNQPQPRLNTLTRRKRQNTDDSDIYLDYVILKHLETTLGRLQQQNVIRLKRNKLIRKKRQESDDRYIDYVLLDVLNVTLTGLQEQNVAQLKWRIEIPLPGSDTNVRILDLMLETPLRYCYRWLCENHYLISRWTQEGEIDVEDGQLTWST